ncbi:DEAD/DEAH box helicase [Candidatus Woesearchaeota archaeon]|nr:DEAD/DEAH box helicase [Candidatus Woesearchaeota archaeon]
MIEFKQFNFSHGLAESIEKLGFENPTQIQERSIPPIMEERDVLGESATGSGKTLAFGCGIIEKTIPGKGLQALVLTPTRELAEQVKDAICQLASNKHLKIISVYGGVSIGPQIESLRKAEVVIATPGRFKDHLERRTIDTSRISIFVLDEADRMLDMGFIDDIEIIIRSCPNRKQTLFFSATIPPRIETLSQRYLHNPVKVSARKQVDPEKLKQVYYDVPRNLKFSLLVHLLKNEDSGLVMVFCNTRRSTEAVIKNLRANGIDAVEIHGGLTQNKRTRAIEQFKRSKKGVLVCTDVAARGLHIDGISHIYNYDIAGNPIDYVHRIGRTARAGEQGKVINLLCDYDHDNFTRVLSEYRSFSIENVQMPYIERIMIRRNSSPRRMMGRTGPRRGFYHKTRR